MALPRFFGLKSNYNNKYLRYVHEDVEVHGFNQFSGDEVVSPYAKYEMVMAKSGNGLVNIRSCYNNKYWARWSQNHWWIVAGADEPEEDSSKWSCTLFELISVDAKTIRIRHAQLGHYARLWRLANSVYDSCLFAGETEPNDDLGLCTIIDWDSMFILPKHVAFKGDSDGYLSGQLFQGLPYLRFASSEIEDTTVVNEVFTTSDGSIRIKSNHFGKFWSRSSNNSYILADSDDTSSNNSTDGLFWPGKVFNDNHQVDVATLLNLGNNNLCRRFTNGSMISFLSANLSEFSVHAQLWVEEPVLSRSIDNVDYHLIDARIYSKSVITIAEGNAINRTQEPITLDVKLFHTESRSSIWNSSVSTKLVGVKTSIQAGVPLIADADGKIQVSGNFNGQIEWGKTEVSTTTVETEYKGVTLPPMTMVKVSLISTTASCDVPFSYTQRDTLFNGQEITYTMNDGIYTGINSFNLKYEITEEKVQ